MTATQKVYVLSFGCPWFVRDGGVKYLGWEPFPGTCNRWMLVSICQASLWGLHREQVFCCNIDCRATDVVASSAGTQDESPTEKDQADQCG